MRVLVHDALRRTPAGRRVEVRDVQMELYVMLGMEDSGIGIPAEDRERVFERFWHGGEAGRGSAWEGNGPGLAIATGWRGSLRRRT